MRVIIDSDITAGGNPRRGYHDNTGTVTFTYAVGGPWYTEEREIEIVEALHDRPSQMWWNYRGRDVSREAPELALKVIYKINFGIDSGD